MYKHFKRYLCKCVYIFGTPAYIYIYIYRRSSTCLQGKALPVNAMKECERSEYIALFILHLGSGLSPVSRPRPLNKRGQISLYPLNWRRGGPHNRTTRFGENINPLSLLKFEPRIVYPAAQSLHYVRYPGAALHQMLELYFYHKNNGMGRESLDWEHYIQSHHERSRCRDP